jgi:hypothetical protein
MCVKASEAEQIVAAMLKHHVPVACSITPDEGHDCRRPENHRSFATAAESFLTTPLGERREPVGEGFKNSTIEFRTGRELVPGLN